MNVRPRLLILLCLVFVVLTTGSALSESLTFDERTDLEVGIRAWRNQELSVEPYNPILIRLITSLPVILGIPDAFGAVTPNIYFFPSRFISILFGLGILLLTYILATAIFNKQIALVSVFILSFEPVFLAHSHYAAHDAGSVFFFLFAYAYLVFVLKNPGRRGQVIGAVLTGLVCAAKLTVGLYFIATLAFLFILLKGKASLAWIFKNFRILILICAITILTIWSTYFFRTGLIIGPGSAGGRVSDSLIAIARSTQNQVLEWGVVYFRTQAVPLGDYLAIIKNNILRIQVPGEVFFFGSMYPDSKWYFLPVNAYFNTSLPVILLSLIGMAYILQSRKKLSAALIIIPILTITVISSLLQLKPYVRYLLVLYPFLSISAAHCAVRFVKDGKSFLVLLLFLWLTLGTLLTYPHFLTFKNESLSFFGQPYLYMADSNLDWGQGLIALRRYEETKNVRVMNLEYFGTDEPAQYGFATARATGGTTITKLCNLYPVQANANNLMQVTALSVTGWHYCDFKNIHGYGSESVIDTVEDMFLVFRIPIGSRTNE